MSKLGTLLFEEFEETLDEKLLCPVDRYLSQISENLNFKLVRKLHDKLFEDLEWNIDQSISRARIKMLGAEAEKI